jgi:hypothetical protein
MAALRRDFDARPTIIVAGGIGVAGALALAIGIAVEPRRALAAYLAAWVTAVTIAVGGLAMLLIGYAANARWPAAIRRLTEAIACALGPLALLLVPLLVGARHLWPWVEHGGRSGYLTLPGFVVRAVIYFAIWIAAAELLVAWSRRHDRLPMPQVGHGMDALDRERTLASAFVPLAGLALTFAAFDWLMSLQPRWASTVFGLYVICGTLGAGLATTIALAWLGVRARAIPLTGDHFHAMGRLLLAYVVLWAYIAYFQAFLIQIANRPDEVTFYLARTADGWRAITVLVIALRFAVPFPALVLRRAKFRPAYTGTIAALVLIGHYLDVWWLVIPPFGGPLPSWLDGCALCAVFGLAIAAAAWRAHGVPLLPIGDPYLQAGLTYTSKT